MNKSIKKIIVISASLLMMASISVGVGSLSRPVHAISQVKLAKIFASKDPDKATDEFADEHGATTTHDVKLSSAEQKQQEQELAVAEKQGEKAGIMQEEDGAHVNAPHAKILNAGSMALSKANGKLADKLNNALQHKNYRLIKRLTAKVNAQNRPSKKTTRRHKAHKHTKKSKRIAKKSRRTHAKHHRARKHHAESTADIIASAKRMHVGVMNIDKRTPEQKRDDARATAWANKVDRNNDIKDYESEGMTRSQAIARENAYEKQKQARMKAADHQTTKKRNRRHAKRNHRAKKHGRRTHARKHVTKKRDRK